MEPDRQQAIELIERADILIAGGHSEVARGFLEHALEVDPLNEEARRMLAGVVAGERGETLSSVLDRDGLVAVEREDLGVITRRERVTGNDQIVVALTQRMAGLGSTPTGTAGSSEGNRYAATSEPTVDPIFARAPAVKEARPPARYSPVGIVVWFIIGSLLGAIALYGWLFVRFLPNLHKMLQWTPSTELGACAALGLFSAALLGRSRPVD